MSCQGALLVRISYGLLTISVVSIIFSIAVSSISMGLAIVSGLAYLVAERRVNIARTGLDMFILLYALAELLATVFSVEPAHSFFNMKRLFLVSIMYLTCLWLVDTTRLRRTVMILIAVGAIFAVVEIISATPSGGHFERISLFQYYLTSGGIKMFVLLLIVPFLVHPSTPSRIKWALVSAAIPLGLALLLTQTRSAWLGMMAGTIVIGIARSRWLIAVLVLLVILFLLVAPNEFRQRAASIFDPSMTSNLTRIHMIETGWRMFLDRPLVGTGDIDLKQLYLTYTVPIDEAEGGHLHNNIMMLLVTLGIVGFAASMALFVRIGILEWRSHRLTKHDWLLGSLSLGALASYAGFHIMGLFEWNFGDHEIAVLLWLTVGLSLASAKIMAGQAGVRET
jgi:O-antigen ligase